jgi:hypothetical protein
MKFNAPSPESPKSSENNQREIQVCIEKITALLNQGNTALALDVYNRTNFKERPSREILHKLINDTALGFLEKGQAKLAENILSSITDTGFDNLPETKTAFKKGIILAFSSGFFNNGKGIFVLAISHLTPEDILELKADEEVKEAVKKCLLEMLSYGDYEDAVNLADNYGIAVDTPDLLEAGREGFVAFIEAENRFPDSQDKFYHFVKALNMPNEVLFGEDVQRAVRKRIFDDTKNGLLYSLYYFTDELPLLPPNFFDNQENKKCLCLSLIENIKSYIKYHDEEREVGFIFVAKVLTEKIKNPGLTPQGIRCNPFGLH